MRKIIVLAAAVLITALSVLSFAAEKSILFVNSVDQEIKRIHLSPAGANEWGPNLLDKYKLHPGKNVRVAVPHDRGNCKWDLKYVVVNKLAYTIKDIDICQAREIELFLKGKEAWANIK
jgi:hypothetical protein